MYRMRGSGGTDYGFYTLFLWCAVCSSAVEALRPGVFALMSACSPEDLQFLHAAFGQGKTQSHLNCTVLYCTRGVWLIHNYNYSSLLYCMLQRHIPPCL